MCALGSELPELPVLPVATVALSAPSLAAASHALACASARSVSLPPRSAALVGFRTKAVLPAFDSAGLTLTAPLALTLAVLVVVVAALAWREVALADMDLSGNCREGAVLLIAAAAVAVADNGRGLVMAAAGASLLPTAALLPVLPAVPLLPLAPTPWFAAEAEDGLALATPNLSREALLSRDTCCCPCVRLSLSAEEGFKATVGRDPTMPFSFRRERASSTMSCESVSVGYMVNYIRCWF